MLILLSPSKTLNLNSEIKTQNFTKPKLIKYTKELIKEFQKYSSEDLEKMMKVSKKIADLNYERFHNFSFPFNKGNSRQALFTFKGDVYKDIDVENYNEKDLNFAQKQIRIISGLYGVLKPLDLMQAYRLEMHLKTDYWKDKVTQFIKEDLKESKTKNIINLASNEYFSAVNPKNLEAGIYKIDFKEKKEDQFKIVAIYAKRARGTMSNFIIKNRISKPEELKDFKENGYKYNKSLSSERDFVFTR